MRRTFLVLLFALDVSFGQAPRQSAPPPHTPAPTPASGQSLRGRLNYKPVGPGVPSGRVDAGSRGEGDEVASLYVIAPENVGLTTHSQPALFWFQTAPAQLPCEITLLRPNDPTPVLRLRGSNATTSGFHRLELADHGIQLAPGVDYQWVVALIRDPRSRSRDIVSSGWIRHATPRGSAPKPGDAVSLAAAGFWYDTVAALFAQIDTHPRDAQLAADRRDLLTQVGLPPLPSIPSAKRQ